MRLPGEGVVDRLVHSQMPVEAVHGSVAGSRDTMSNPRGRDSDLGGVLYFDTADWLAERPGDRREVSLFLSVVRGFEDDGRSVSSPTSNSPAKSEDGSRLSGSGRRARQAVEEDMDVVRDFPFDSEVRVGIVEGALPLLTARADTGRVVQVTDVDEPGPSAEMFHQPMQRC